MARKKVATQDNAEPKETRARKVLAEVPEHVATDALKQCGEVIGKMALEHGLTNLQARELYRQTLRVSRKAADSFVWNFSFGR